MANGSCLTGETATVNGDLDIKFAKCIGCRQGLANDGFQGLQTKVIIDGSLIDRDLPFAGGQVDSGDGFLSS